MTDTLTTTTDLLDQDDDLVVPQDREEPELSGADLARTALQAARRTARAAGNAPAKRKKPTVREITRQGLDAREPAGLAAVVPAMADAHGWALGTARGSIRDRWATIVGTESAQHWAPAGFDPDTRTLRVLADSPAWATKLRLQTRQLLQQLDQHLPPGSVKAIDIRTGHHQMGPDYDDRPRTPAAPAPADDRPHPLADSTTYQQLRQQMREQVLAREAAQEEERAQKEEILRQHYGWLREPEDAHRLASDALAAEHAAAQESAAHARRLRDSHNAALAAARAAKAGATPLHRARRPVPRSGAA